MKNTFWVTEILLRIALQAKNGDTCPQGQVFLFFFNFESSAAENDVITMQPSCSQLNLSVIIALIILAACRLMVTVLSLDGVSGRKWGSHFTQSFPPELSSSQSRKCCQSLKMTPISPIWGLHTCAEEACVHIVTHLRTTGDGSTTTVLH